MVSERKTDHNVDGDGRPVIENLGARQYSPNPGTLTMAVYKYQIWSSALGQAVATMDPSGNQIENRIYAGSTLIATARGRHTTGSSADDAIDFHVKEPVTNTEVTYAYNATTSNWATAEQEPFGQNISSIDPYIEEWNNYGQVLNGAQDPEWQCTLHKMMNGEFTSMPTHCAKAAWESEFVIFGTPKNKSLESLKKMMDTPLQKPSIPGVESETRDNLALAAKATYKSEKGGPRDSEDPDIPNCGTEDCVVTVKALDVPIIDASTSGNAVFNDKISNGLKKATELVKSTRCADFVAWIVKTTEASYGYVNPGVSSLTTISNGTFVTEMPSNSKIASGTLELFSKAQADGRISSSTKSGRRGKYLDLARTKNNSQIEFYSEFFSKDVDADAAALVVLHESLHLTLGFSDQAIALAVSAYKGGEKKYFDNTEDGSSQASEYWDRKLVEHCGQVKLTTGVENVIR